MEYWEKIKKELTPWIDVALNKTVIDLFAGCGGLSLGFEANGFKTIGYEMEEYAAETYNRNILCRCVQKTLTVDTVYPKAGSLLLAGRPVFGNRRHQKNF